jgi:hypothetical protein
MPYVSVEKCSRTSTDLGYYAVQYRGESYEEYNGTRQCQFDYIEGIDGLNNGNVKTYYQCTDGDSSTPDIYYTWAYKKTYSDYSCSDPSYPIAVDSDLDGQIDQCYANNCPPIGQGEMFPGEGVPNNVCITMQDGSVCKYNNTTFTDDAGNNLGQVLVPTGEACLVGTDEHIPSHNPWGNPDDQFNDPSGGCYQSGSMQICSADQSQTCTGSGADMQCPQNCGTVNGNFVCVTDTSGQIPNPTNGNGRNENNVENDDPQTPGDEGTHSRLDGLLQNTDEIEHLLRQIRDRLSNQSDGEQQDMQCPSGYNISGKCVNFQGRDNPQINDVDIQLIDDEITILKNELETTINQIKNEFSAMINIDMSSSANYETRTSNIFGVNVDFGLARIMQHVNLGSIVIFICSVWAVFIILSGRSD